MTKSAIAARILPVAIVAAVLGASLLVRPVTINSNNAALCGYQTGYGYGTTPAVDTVTPNTGSTAGGTIVTLTGCGFTGTTAVTFGATPATAFTVNSDTKITATSPAHAAGTVDVRVTTPAGTSPTQPGDQFTYSAAGTCSSVTLSAAPASPSRAGTQIVLTAVASGCPNALYEFWARWTGTTTWVLLQAYSTNNQYHWNSTGAAPGTENFGVWAKDTSSTAAYDTFISIPYTVSSPCDSATISANPTSVIQASGTHVTITGGAVNCVNPNPQFEFWARWSGSPTWVLLQGYSTKATYDWDSNGALPGTENFGVWVRDSGSTAAYDALASTQVMVVPATCPSVTVTAVPTTVVHSSSGGTHIIATATATGCNGAGPEYAFWLRPSTSPKWILLNGYTTTNTYNWNTTGAPVDTYYIGVWAKDGHSSNSYDAINFTTVTVT